MLLFVLQSQGAVDRLKQENYSLQKTNSVLLKTLRQLATETRVGVNSAVGGSEAMVGKSNGCDYDMKKSCTGTRIDLRWYNREQEGYPAYGRDLGKEWCHRQCEYFGLDGCCEYLLDEDECYFQLDGTVQDDDYSKRIMTTELGVWPAEYTYEYYRYGGMCKYSGNLLMMDYNRVSGCEWDGLPNSWTTGNKQMPGSSNSEVDCTAWCLDDPDCVFAQHKNGVCKTFRTCTRFNSNRQAGWKMWQKVNENSPHEWEDTYNRDYCSPDCETYKDQWIGDGMCDTNCRSCTSYNTNGVVDGGDC